MSQATGHHVADGSGQLALARQVVQREAQTLLRVAERLDGAFCQAVQLIGSCSGSLIVTGMGKAGLVGQKIAATFASTGTPAHFLHPAESVHGDLGRVRADDVVLALSMSGRTEEVVRLAVALVDRRIPVLAITARAASPLGRLSRVCLELGEVPEACPLGLAPSSSTTAMLAVGDALALVVSHALGFGAEDFARFHPGGSLGRRLATVDQVMRPVAQCRLADQAETVRQLLIRSGRPGRRTGAVMVTGQGGTLVGIFTDSDLARLLERRADGLIDGPVRAVMTPEPATIDSGSRVEVAVQCLRRKKISELPVVDQHGRPIGLIDVTDLLDYFPAEAVRDVDALDLPAPLRATSQKDDPTTAILPFPQRPSS